MHYIFAPEMTFEDSDVIEIKSKLDFLTSCRSVTVSLHLRHYLCTENNRSFNRIIQVRVKCVLITNRR